MSTLLFPGSPHVAGLLIKQVKLGRKEARLGPITELDGKQLTYSEPNKVSHF